MGAAGEVGRSGFLVNCDGTNLLLDYGVMFSKKRNDPPLYPLHVKPKDVDAAVITHAHLDHSGCVPALFNGGNTSVYFFRFNMEWVYWRISPFFSKHNTII